MEKEFIQVNDAVLDYTQYVREAMLLKSYLKKTLTEAALTTGFEVIKNENPTYSETTLIFFHKEKDLEAKLEIRKRSEEKFV